MSRALVILNGPPARQSAHHLIDRAPVGTRVEFKGARRTLPQNDRLWAMLTDVSRQKEHAGRKYPAEVWKLLFMDAWSYSATQYIPNLDDTSVLPVQKSSRDLSKDEMSELIEFIAAWGAENGVRFGDDETPPA